MKIGSDGQILVHRFYPCILYLDLHAIGSTPMYYVIAAKARL